MAANRIKGITVEIGGDTTKLQTALQGLNGIELRYTQNELYEMVLSVADGSLEYEAILRWVLEHQE